MPSAATEPAQNDSSAATSSPATKKEEKSTDQPVTPELVDLVVAELRFQTAFYLERVQAMMDGTTLGAEQVQDKRIESLEECPTTEPGTILFTVILTLVLEGTVGPAIASLATRTVLRPLLRATGKAITAQNRRKAANLVSDMYLYKREAALARDAVYNIKSTGAPLNALKGVEAYAQASQAAAETLRKDLRGTQNEAKIVRETLNAITNFTENNLVAAAKAGVAVQNLPHSYNPLQAEDSPSVSVVATAMTEVSKLRLMVIATHEALEAEIKRPDIKMHEVRTILREYRVDDSAQLEDIRDSYQLTTEVMIWAALLLNEHGKQRGEARNNPGGRWLLKPGADKHIEYLLKRFGKEIERWALEKSELLVRELSIKEEAQRFLKPYLDPPRPTGFWEGLGSLDQEDLLSRYLAFVAAGTPREFKLK